MNHDPRQADPKTRVTGSLGRPALAFATVAGASLAGLAILVFLDVVGRYFLGRPLPFAVELIELMVAVVAAGALPLASLRRSHVAVDLLETVAGTRIRQLLALVSATATFAFLALMCWQLAVRAIALHGSGLETPILGWPVYPVAVFAMLAAAAAALMVPAGRRPAPDEGLD